MSRDAAAIIVAGGQGRRFDTCLPAGRTRVRKQYLAIQGRPLLWWALHAFERCRSIGATVLVVPREDLARVRRLIRGWRLRKPVHVVSGGETRADSVRQGLVGLPPGYRWVAVHDAVRPLVTPDLIENVLKAARRHRAAIAAYPSQDTVKLARRSRVIERTLPRSGIWLAQTPQVFERTLLERAHGLRGNVHRGRWTVNRRKSAHGSRFTGHGVTDDAQLVERLGVRVKLVEGSASNLKVTVPRDLQMAQWLLQRIKENGKR